MPRRSLKVCSCCDGQQWISTIGKRGSGVIEATFLARETGTGLRGFVEFDKSLEISSLREAGEAAAP